MQKKQSPVKGVQNASLNDKHFTSTNDIRQIIRYDRKLDYTINEDVAMYMYKLTSFVFYREATFQTFKNPFMKNSPPYRADAACPALKLMVEYNGKYHYDKSDWPRTRNDVLKRRWCKLNGYTQIVVPASVYKNILQAYLHFRLLTDTDIRVKCDKSDVFNEVVFTKKEIEWIDYVLHSVLPNFLEGCGKRISSLLIFNDITSECTIAFRLQYPICKDVIRDPSTNRILQTYDDNCCDYGATTLYFWKNRPIKNVNRPNDIHIPLFLIGTRNKETSLAKYISYRLIDTIDQATVFWKI